VLAPDISDYAPYIETVFGVEHEGEPPIPFTIADRSPRYEQSIVDAALRILDLIDARATASSVVDLLDVAAVRRAARIGAGEVATVREWVRATHIRWGIDERHRHETLGLPCDGADTWRTGLDRLLMGYAVGESESLVAGILPAAGAGASEAALLGRFAAFTDTLFRHLTALRARRTLGHWARDLRLAFDDLIEARDDVEEEASALVRNAIERLHELGERTGLDESVEVAVVRSAVASAVDAQGRRCGLPHGRGDVLQLEADARDSGEGRLHRGTRRRGVPAPRPARELRLARRRAPRRRPLGTRRRPLPVPRNRSGRT
jgi:exodeoxyribonuclease V gamma subunit